MSRGKCEIDWTDEEIAILRELFAAGMSDAEIGERTGRSECGVAHKRRQLNLRKHRAPLHLTGAQQVAVLVARNAGWTVKRIAERAGVSYDTMLSIVHDLELQERACGSVRRAGQPSGRRQAC